MPRTKEELKAAACAAIDKNKEKIFAIGDSIYEEPELGYKEVKTAKKFSDLLSGVGIEHRTGVALTGIVAPLKGRSSKMRLSIMGELDAVVAPGHPNADPLTGAAHCCGHNCMIAGLSGVAIALKEAGIMEELDGDIVLMGVPAEEYVEIEYRNSLKEAGKIHFLGGKPEFVRIGEMDDIDMMIMQHTTGSIGSDIWADCGGEANGFVGKLIRYKGKEAHAGGSPHKGINALNAAQLGLAAVNAQRETFQDKDHIRVHPIITKGGDLVNVIPADVRLETYVRGANVDAILDASAKTTRAFEAGGYAVGAETTIIDLPGYLPVVECAGLKDLMYANLCQLLGEEHVKKAVEGGAGSTDAGDISQLMPVIQASIGGADGGFHSETYRLVDRDLAYIVAAKALTMTAIDLLADGAKAGLAVKANYKPNLTKEAYLKDWGGIKG